jgi:hypothetical protein
VASKQTGRDVDTTGSETAVTPERDWTRLVDELIEAHPRYRRVTLERLVERTARELSGADDVESSVREAAIHQLRYIEEAESPRPLTAATPRKARRIRSARWRERLRGGAERPSRPTDCGMLPPR